MFARALTQARQALTYRYNLPRNAAARNAPVI